jgi:chromatin remodeling complex protein RSC6
MTSIETPSVQIASPKPINTNNDYIEYSNIIEQMNVMKQTLTKMVSSVKILQKEASKKRKTTNVKSGFVKPVPLSLALSELIGTKPDELVSRNIVNRKINEYIKANNLQVENARQTFAVDEKLANLFAIPTGDIVHYFKMQTFLKYHYPKAASVLAGEAEAVALVAVEA